MLTKKILLDMDGVLADFNLGFYRRWCELYPNLPSINPEMQGRRYVSECYRELLGEDGEKKALAIIEDPNFFSTLPEIPFAIEASNKLMSLGHQVYICFGTTPGYDFETSKMRWVREHFDESWLDRIIATGDKTQVTADILIDDNQDLKSDSWKHILYTQYHNKESEKPRIVSWQYEIEHGFPFLTY